MTATKCLQAMFLLLKYFFSNIVKVLSLEGVDDENVDPAAPLSAMVEKSTVTSAAFQRLKQEHEG